MFIAVAFVTYNRSDLPAYRVRSIRRRSGFDGYQVEYIVAAGAVEPEHLGRIGDMSFDRCVLSQKNRGISANPNARIVAVSGKLILQVQDDWQFVGNPDVPRRAIDVLGKCVERCNRFRFTSGVGPIVSPAEALGGAARILRR